MQVTETHLKGVLLIEPVVHQDRRGFFIEVYRDSIFREKGIETSFVQDNHSQSNQGVIRGLHYQLRHPQVKLCRVVSGAVLDVVVDIRRGSPTFGQSMTVELSAANNRQIYVPAGVAHGFAVLSRSADFLYKCAEEYDPDDEYGIRWNDPGLGIAWPVKKPTVSARDQCLPLLNDVPLCDLPKFTS